MIPHRTGPARILPGRHISALVLWVFLLAASGCAPVRVKPQAPPFSRAQITRIVSAIVEQDRRVRSFFCSGTLTITRGDTQRDVHVLIIGDRSPYRLKIEMRHAWGRPLAHILIRETGISILSFTEKRFYTGDLGAPGVSKFIPAGLDRDQIWGISRGFPLLGDHHGIISPEGGRITLLDRRKIPVRILDLYPDRMFPRRLFFPESGITISFSEPEADGGLRWAKDIRVTVPGADTRLDLRIRRMVFNRPLPAAVFRMAVPPGFKRCPLD